MKELLTLGLVLLSAVASARPDEVIVFQGRREPSEAGLSTRSLRYIPFVVPPGVTRIAIHKDITQGPGAQHGVIDHGLFDPRGAGPGGPGFRGWMGGSDADIVLDGTAADSRFFIGGSIQPGKWNLAQFYLASSAGGLNYKYTVTLSFGGRKPPAAMPKVPEYSPGVLNSEKNWYIGDFHNHTIASDGDRTLSDLARFHKDSGFEFIAVTDHNTTRQQYEYAGAAKANPDLLMLFGEEITTPFGHANVIGTKPGEWFDFRMNAGDGQLPQAIDRAHNQGALFCVNHPFADCMTCGWRFPADEFKAADAIEVWNGVWDSSDLLALDLWDRMLKNGRHVIALGGSDYHRGEIAITPAAWVYADNLSTKGIMDGIKRGHVVLTDGRFGARVTISARKGRLMGGDSVILKPNEKLPVEIQVVRGQMYGVHIVWAGGETTLWPTADDCTLEYAIPAQARYVRAELVAADKSVASLTNPIYISSQ